MLSKLLKGELKLKQFLAILSANDDWKWLPDFLSLKWQLRGDPTQYRSHVFSAPV